MSLGAVGRSGSGVKPGGAGALSLDGFVGQHGERGSALPPFRDRAPDLLSLVQLNRAVERAHRTHTQEFYPLTPGSRETKKLNRQLRPWENPFNTLRPHPALGDLPPQQFLRQLSSQRKQ